MKINAQIQDKTLKIWPTIKQNPTYNMQNELINFINREIKERANAKK